MTRKDCEEDPSLTRTKSESFSATFQRSVNIRPEHKYIDIVASPILWSLVNQGTRMRSKSFTEEIRLSQPVPINMLHEVSPLDRTLEKELPRRSDYQEKWTIDVVFENPDGLTGASGIIADATVIHPSETHPRRTVVGMEEIRLENGITFGLPADWNIQFADDGYALDSKSHQSGILVFPVEDITIEEFQQESRVEQELVIPDMKMKFSKVPEVVGKNMVHGTYTSKVQGVPVMGDAIFATNDDASKGVIIIGMTHPDIFRPIFTRTAIKMAQTLVIN